MPDLNQTKTFLEALFYVVAAISSGFAVWTYVKNQSLERSRWASSLYESFYESVEHKGIRRELDCSADSQNVATLVEREPPEFTDYLNFFEHVAYLVKCEQIKREDAEAYFDYYFKCLQRHPSVLRYIENESNGYEELRRYLGS
jgi:hypothetical protein